MKGNSNAKIRYLNYFALFLFISFTYYSSHAGIRDTNEGSHYALVASYVGDGTINTDRHVHLSAWGNDFSYNQGHFRTDRSPGTAIVLTPFYFLGKWMAPFLGNTDQEEAQRHGVLVASAMCGALTAVLLVAIAELLGLQTSIAWIIGLTLALGTYNWKYSSHIFAHIFTTANFLFVVWLTLREAKHPDKRLDELIGFFTGTLVLFAYEAILFWPGLIALRFLVNRQRKWAWAEHFAYSISFLFPITLLMWFHAVNWGAPWRTFGAFNSPFHGSNRSADAFFTKPLSIGLNEVLWNAKPMACPRGIFYSFPILLAAIPGFYFFWKKHRSRFLALLFPVLAFILFFAKRPDNTGGSCCQVRHVLPIIPILALSLGFFLQDFVLTRKSGPLKAVLICALSVLGVFGALFSILHFITFHGHNFDFKRDISEYSLASMTAINAVWSKLFVADANYYPLLYAAFGIATVALVAMPMLSAVAARMLPRASIRLASWSILVVFALTKTAWATWIAFQPPTKHFGEVCVHQFSANSLLDIIRFENASPVPIGFAKYPHQQLPADVAIESQSEAMEFVALSASADLPEAKTINIAGEIDDEVRILLNNEVVFEYLGVHGGRGFNAPLALKAGSNELRILYSNLGGDATLRFDLDDPTVGALFHCNSKPGFCQSRTRSRNPSELPNFVEFMAQQPLTRHQLPVSLYFEKEIELIMLRGEVSISNNTPVSARMNYLFDDAALLEVDKQPIEQNPSMRYPWGVSREVVLEPGVHHFQISQANLSGSGDLWFHVFEGDDSPLAVRCPPEERSP